LIFFPTARAVFDGSVHGVVVQEIKKTGLLLFENKNELLELLIILN
jgi:hypothetical protein